MKIDSPGKAIAPSSTADIRPRTPASPSRAEAGSTDKVELSSLSSSLQKAESTLADSPVIDRQRVDEIRQAITEGRFKVDAGRIADGLLSSVRDLLASQG